MSELFEFLIWDDWCFFVIRQQRNKYNEYIGAIETTNYGLDDDLIMTQKRVPFMSRYCNPANTQLIHAWSLVDVSSSKRNLKSKQDAIDTSLRGLLEHKDILLFMVWW